MARSEAIGAILVIIGWVLLVGANLTAIGVGLYDWAFNMELPMAAWGAFVLWLKMLASGAISLILGVALTTK